MLHTLCEQVLNGQCETPPSLAKVSRVLDRLRVNQAKAEQAWRVDAQWQPVASGSWLLGYVDVTFTRDGLLHVYDFKSGKPYPSHKSQLELYALLGLAQNLEAPAVSVGAIYLDTGKIGAQRTIDRVEAMTLRANWTSRALALMADEAYQPKRGRGCYRCAFKDSLGGPCSAWKAG